MDSTSYLLKMRLKEFQTLKTASFVHIPFSTFWSVDNYVASATDKGVHIAGGVFNRGSACWLYTTLVLSLVASTFAGDITQNVFGYKTNFIPAAFGDFNADEYTDLFVIHDDHKTVEVLLGSDSDPLLRHNDSKLQCTFQIPITSVVPGDFDGDALLDLLVTTKIVDKVNSVRILWGELTELNCSSMTDELFRMFGQPLAIDYDPHNKEMIMDVFGEDEHRVRTFWLFNKNRTIPTRIPLVNDQNMNRKFSHFRYPHSNAFLDLNQDSSPDLYLTSQDSYEVWVYDKGTYNYDPSKSISLPPSNSNAKSPHIIGQTLFMDIELDGKMDHLVPVCYDSECKDSELYVYSSGKWHNLQLNFKDSNNKNWGFLPPEKKEEDNYFRNTITLHGGDFNMDGYPDLLVTLKCGNLINSYLLENVECPGEKCSGFSRTFTILWTSLSPYNNGTILGVFFDFAQNGILDILFVHSNSNSGSHSYISAFKNNLDYDANFIKVMVLTGLTNQAHLEIPTPLKRMRRIYGTSYPGAIIWYETTTQEGVKRAAIAPQLPQSAYFSLHLPYSLFGLGRAPNFVDSLSVGFAGHNKTWKQIIPNSQMVVVSQPPEEPNKWFAQLFVTPSKIIVKTILALLGTCALISVIIIILWWKERRQDHLERLQEAHRFHFDAM